MTRRLAVLLAGLLAASAVAAPSVQKTVPPGQPRVTHKKIKKKDPLEGLEDPLHREDLARIAEVAQVIYDESVNDVDVGKMIYGAMRGMAATVDPWTEFFDPEEYKGFLKAEAGEYTGIGVVLSYKDDGMPAPIKLVYPHSPAEKAGLKRGDEIVEVEGAETGPMTADEVARHILGPKGKAVSLKASRYDPKTKLDSRLEVSIVRDDIKTNNVLAKLVGDKGYLYFDYFRQDSTGHASSADEIVAKVRDLRAHGAKSLILDLRGNSGGSVEACELIAAAFLHKGDAIVVTVDRDEQAVRTDADSDGPFADLPLTVLVDGETASASEILAGALQDHKRAKVVGMTTFGKGVAQSFFTFNDGSALKVTTNRWLTPNLKSIDRDPQGHGGITPNVVVTVPYTQESAVVDQIVHDLNGEPLDRDAAPDPILAKALAL